MTRAVQNYASLAFKSFFHRQSLRQPTRLKDLAVRMEGLDVSAQSAVLKLVLEAEAKKVPEPYNASIEAFRRHNHSLLRLEGQCVYGKVRNFSFD